MNLILLINSVNPWTDFKSILKTKKTCEITISLVIRQNI
jgi:hypothetical protein